MAEQETNLSATYQLRRQARGAEPPPKQRRWLLRLITGAAVVLCGSLLAVGLWIWWSYTHVSTVSATLAASVVSISPKADGRVVAVVAEEQEHVEAGRQLLRLDDAEARAAVEAAEAMMALRTSEYLQAQETLAMTRSLRASEEARAQAQVHVAEARCAEARAVLERVKKGVRQEEIDAARSRLDSARALQALRELEVQQSEELLTEGIESRHALEIARTQLALQKNAVRQAELEVQRLCAGAFEEDVRAVESALTAREAELEEARAQLALVLAQQMQVTVAEERVTGAKAQLDGAQAGLDRARSTLRAASVDTDVPGIVTRIYPNVGEFCRRGETVVLVADPGKGFWIDAYVSERDAPLVGVGQPAHVRILAGPRSDLEGEVTQISEHTQSRDSGGDVGPAAQGERVWVKIRLREELPPGLKHGMTARAVIKVR